MKFVLLLLSTLVFTIGCGSMPQIHEHQKHRTVVFPATSESGSAATAAELALIRDGVMESLGTFGVVRLVERERIDELLKERELEQAGIIQASQARELAGMVEADAMVFVSLNKTTSARLNKPDSAGNTVVFSAHGSARMVNAVSGEVIATITVEAKTAENEYFMNGISGTGSNDMKALRSAAIKKLSTELGWQLAAMIPPKR